MNSSCNVELLCAYFNKMGVTGQRRFNFLVSSSKPKWKK